MNRRNCLKTMVCSVFGFSTLTHCASVDSPVHYPAINGSSLVRAIEMAKSGDTIELAAGEYNLQGKQLGIPAGVMAHGSKDKWPTLRCDGVVCGHYSQLCYMRIES